MGFLSFDGGAGGGVDGGTRSKSFVDGEDEISIESFERGRRSFETEGKIRPGFRSSGKAGSFFPRFAGEETLHEDGNLPFILSFRELLKVSSGMAFPDCSTGTCIILDRSEIFLWEIVTRRSAQLSTLLHAGTLVIFSIRDGGVIRNDRADEKEGTRGKTSIVASVCDGGATGSPKVRRISSEGFTILVLPSREGIGTRARLYVDVGVD